MNTIFNHITIKASKHLLDRVVCHELTQINVISSRSKYYNNRHRDPKYRRERGRKLWKIELPDFDKERLKEKTGINISPDESRAKMKEKGIAPPNLWSERELFYPCSITTIEPYKPAENEGISSNLMGKLKKPVASGIGLVKNRRALASIKTYEGEDFDLTTFASQSVDIYKKAHQAIASKDEMNVFNYITEHCFPMMTTGLDFHTVNWKFLDILSPPVAVQVRVGDLVSKTNKFAQITVRMHSKQMLAIYDRHGRLVFGSPTDVKEVYEYIVYEKFLANEYGSWRLHDRMRPGSSPSYRDMISKTYRVESKI